MTPLPPAETRSPTSSRSAAATLSSRSPWTLTIRTGPRARMGMRSTSAAGSQPPDPADNALRAHQPDDRRARLHRFLPLPSHHVVALPQKHGHGRDPERPDQLASTSRLAAPWASSRWPAKTVVNNGRSARRRAISSRGAANAAAASAAACKELTPAPPLLRAAEGHPPPVAGPTAATRRPHHHLSTVSRATT